MVELSSALASHAQGRGLESRRRHLFSQSRSRKYMTVLGQEFTQLRFSVQEVRGSNPAGSHQIEAGSLQFEASSHRIERRGDGKWRGDGK